MRITPGYFILALLALFLFCYLLSNNELYKTKYTEYNSSLINITSDKIPQCISKGHSLILFGDPNSILCKNMEYKLDILAKEKDKNISFYIVDIESEKSIVYKYHISGIPSILIFKDGKEYKRIFGIVPLDNLRMIYERDMK